MPWTTSTRRDRLPPDWDKIRIGILRKYGYQCTKLDDDGERCTERATDVDHIERGDDHRESNLTALCGFHHDQKSAREGAQARTAQARARRARMRRAPEAHPGLISPPGGPVPPRRTR